MGYEARNVDVKTLIHNTDPRSDLYCPENVRFDKDFSAFERRRRDEESKKKDDVMENKRAAYLQRESNKWEKMDKDFNHCQDILDNKKKSQSEAGTYSNGYFHGLTKHGIQSYHSRIPHVLEG